MRLIDADALRKKAQWFEMTDRAFRSDVRAVTVSSIDMMPTIDAVPVVHSFWEEYETSTFGGYKDGEPQWWGRKFFRCERCRKGSAIKSNFCPNCGADMGERKGGDGNG